MYSTRICKAAKTLPNGNQTSHVSPRFHVLFDKHFSSISCPGMTDKVLDQLYKSTEWLNPKLPPDNELPPEYYFDSFWSAPPEETRTYSIGQKRSRPSQATSDHLEPPKALTETPSSVPDQHPTTMLNAAPAFPAPNHQSQTPTKLQYVNLLESPAF